MAFNNKCTEINLELLKKEYMKWAINSDEPLLIVNDEQLVNMAILKLIEHFEILNAMI